MPVEIRELIIRATIVNNQDSHFQEQTIENTQEKEEIISACVAQVLKILERKKQR